MGRARHILIAMSFWPNSPPPTPRPPYDWEAEGDFDDRLGCEATIRQLLANVEAQAGTVDDERFHAGRVAGVRAALAVIRGAPPAHGLWT